MEKGTLVLLLHISSSCCVFVCNNGKAILPEQFCDGQLDCDDESDEIKTNKTCPECKDAEISCTSRINNKTCVLQKHFICKGIITCLSPTPCEAGCRKSHYKCSNGDCFPRSSICDSNSCFGCPEDKEWSTGIGFKCMRSERSCVLPQQLLYDDVQDCDNKEDLCFYEKGITTSINTKRCFQCLDGSIVINKGHLCNGIIDCPDLSDECLCETKRPSICRLVEENIIKNSSVCRIGEFLCDGRCLNRKTICNGLLECSNGVDELYEYCAGTLSCDDAPFTFINTTCRCKDHCQPLEGTLCDGVADCPAPLGVKWEKGSGWPFDECSHVCVKPDNSHYKCTMPEFYFDIPGLNMINCEHLVELPSVDGSYYNHTSTRLVTNRQICDGIVECTVNLEDESEQRCPNRFRCHAGPNMISIPRSLVCDGILHCLDKTDESNVTCPERFICPALGNTKVSIERKHVCDFLVHCDDASDEKNCSTEQRFYCESGKPLFIRERKKFDGIVDCEDWSDECPMKSKPAEDTIFSSRYELVANPFLNAVVWIMGFLAIVGNASVMYGESQTLRRLLSKSDSSSSLQANHLLVLNLSTADFLMGIYLIILGSADAAYSGVYCKYKLEWLSSNTCATMGVLVVLSSQTSVATMVLLTSFRLYAVYNPFSSSTRPTLRTVVLFLFLIWMFSFTIALIPLFRFENTFTRDVLIEDNPYFANTVVKFESAKQLIGRIFIFGQHPTNYSEALNQLRDATKWAELQDLIGKNYSNLLNVERKFSYYSAHSVCMPKIFLTRNDPAWKFSFTVSFWNFLSFLFVAISYLAVYIKSRKTASVRRESLKSQNNSRALQKKILRLVITDFCSWVPVSLMAFVNLSGHPIPKIAYAFAAIVLLPINSSLNPILYSNLLDNYIKKAWARKSSFNTNVTAVTLSYRASTSNRL